MLETHLWTGTGWILLPEACRDHQDLSVCVCVGGPNGRFDWLSTAIGGQRRQFGVQGQRRSPTFARCGGQRVSVGRRVPPGSTRGHRFQRQRRMAAHSRGGLLATRKH